jgi:hypothetical protein
VCPEAATECPEGCQPVVVQALVEQQQGACLGASEVVGCYAVPENILLIIPEAGQRCALSSDGSRIQIGFAADANQGLPLVYDGTCPENWDQLRSCSE